MRVLHRSAPLDPLRAARETVCLLPCQAAGRRFGLEAAHVLAVQTEERFTPSAASTGPLGHVDRQGAAIPVYALAELLGRSAKASSGRVGGLSVIIVVRADPPWAFAVERSEHAVELPAERLFELPRPLSGAAHGKVRGAAVLGGEVVYLLDPAALLHGDPLTGARLRPADSAVRFGGPASRSPQLFRFREPGRDHGANLAVSAAQTLAALHPPPLTPSFDDDERTLGLIPFQGAPVPVLDLGRLLGGPSTRYADANKVLLVRGPAVPQLCALPVGSPPRRLALSGSSRRLTAPPDVRGLLGAFEQDGEQVWPLDIDAALG